MPKPKTLLGAKLSNCKDNVRTVGLFDQWQKWIEAEYKKKHKIPFPQGSKKAFLLGIYISDSNKQLAVAAIEKGTEMYNNEVKRLERCGQS